MLHAKVQPSQEDYARRRRPGLPTSTHWQTTEAAQMQARVNEQILHSERSVTVSTQLRRCPGLWQQKNNRPYPRVKAAHSTQFGGHHVRNPTRSALAQQAAACIVRSAGIAQPAARACMRASVSLQARLSILRLQGGPKRSSNSLGDSDDTLRE